MPETDDDSILVDEDSAGNKQKGAEFSIPPDHAMAPNPIKTSPPGTIRTSSATRKGGPGIGSS